MTSLDSFFEENGTAAAEHPDVRRWYSKMKDASSAVCHLDRERDGLSFNPAVLVVSFRDAAGSEFYSDKVRWDIRLNDWLIAKGVAADTPENEAERLGFAWKSKLEPAVSRYGDGFFSSVLIEWIKSSPLAGQPAVKEVLAQIHYNAPSRGLPEEECREFIDGIIAESARNLVMKLGYSRGDAKDVLVQAVVYYLDERFSVTNRRLLGL